MCTSVLGNGKNNMIKTDISYVQLYVYAFIDAII